MPSFQICYLDDDGSLACSFTAMCANEMHAKVLAHAMKLSNYKTFEVWRDRTLVYERPQRLESGGMKTRAFKRNTFEPAHHGWP